VDYKLRFYKRDDKNKPTMVFEYADWEISSTLLEFDVSVNDMQYFITQIQNVFRGRRG